MSDDKPKPIVGTVSTIIASSAGIATNVSGIAVNVQQQLGNFLQQNSYLTPNSQAIILKSREDTSEILQKMNELTSQLQIANQQLTGERKLRNKLPELLIGGVIGAVLALIFGFAVHFL